MWMVDALACVSAVALCAAAVWMWRALSASSLAGRLICLLCPASQLAVTLSAPLLAESQLVDATTAVAVAALGMIDALFDVWLARAMVRAAESAAAAQRVELLREQLRAREAVDRSRSARTAEERQFCLTAAEELGRLAAELERPHSAVAGLLSRAAAAADTDELWCQNEALNALLQVKAGVCRAVQMGFEACVEVGEDTGLSDVVLASVISNAFEAVFAGAEAGAAPSAGAAAAAAPVTGADAAPDPAAPAALSPTVRLSGYVAHGCLCVKARRAPAAPADSDPTPQPAAAPPAAPRPERGAMRVLAALVERQDGQVSWHADARGLEVTAVLPLP